MTDKKILVVDDDSNILQAYQRQLRKQFQIDTAQGGAEGLDAVAARGPYAVIVSDMRMPEMNGVEFLTKVKQASADSVRMMLTGNADQQTATDAVNDGHIFRFLNKPCPPEEFAKALTAGLEQHRLITSERELLTKTLSGSVSLMTEVLSLVNPVAFGRAARVRRLASQLCERISADNVWEIEIAAMVSQVGCVTVPEKTLAKLYNGLQLSDDEMLMFRRHPEVGRALVAKIPRLEAVGEIIAYQEKHFDGSGFPEDPRRGEDIPRGARLLKIVLDFDTLVSAGQSNEEAYTHMSDRRGVYDPALLELLVFVIDARHAVRSIHISQLEEDMIFDEHVVTHSGEVLIARGQQVTASVCERLKNFANTSRGVREPFRVRCPIGRVQEDQWAKEETTSNTVSAEN